MNWLICRRKLSTNELKIFFFCNILLNYKYCKVIVLRILVSLRKDNMIKSTGPSSGLHLTLSVDTSSHMPLLTNADGVVVAVHSNQDLPLPKLMGTLLRPGTLNRLAVEKQQVTKVGAPYSTCITSYPDFILRNEKFIADNVKPFLTTYHPSLCAKLCQALHQLLSCKKGNCRYAH